MTQASAKPADTRALDTLTGGAFSAPTSGERAARVREWLATDPSPEQMQEVFRELSGRDKGAARLLRERLDEIKRSRGQEAIAAEWSEKARALLAQPKLNIADAIAWQRDAAKAGAPLSREPLATVKAELADRIKGIEDLQHRVQVQREAAVLLAQRIEVLSTKSWQDAQAASQALSADVPDWQAQAEALLGDANWPSVDARFPPLLESSRNQLQVVWDAFRGALAQANAAASDPAAPLPPVPVWADELRAARGVAVEPQPARAARPKVDPEAKARAQEAVAVAVAKLEQEVAQGHGRASTGAAAALRNALKEHAKLVDEKVEAQAHAALAAAGELEGWQRWRADQLRMELVAKAEALFEPAAAEGKAARQARKAVEPAPASPTEAAAATVPESAPEAVPETASETTPETTPEAAPAAESETPPQAAATKAGRVERKPRFGGRKMQEQLRALREQWKQTDQGGPPNHALWKRFDEACNEAYKVVEAWLDKVKAESAEHKAQRVALIDEVKAWAAANTTAAGGDWKGFARVLHQFESRWRDAGHLGERAFAELQPKWKEAINTAYAPLEAVQKQSLERRHAMIEEANTLGAGPLRIDAVKSLQQRWQAEAQAVPVDRKQEQRLWDAFRKPIDEAFNRKTQEREKAAAALSERDRAVLDASKALEAANASGDAQKIKAAMAALEAALRGQAQAAAAVAAAAEPAAAQAGEAATPQGNAAEPAPAAPAEGEVQDSAAPANETQAASAPAPAKPAKPLVAMRGDDRPGMKRAEPAPARGRPGERRPGGKFGDRRDGDRGDRGDRDRRDGRGAPGRFEADRGPRLGDAAFRAQREALEHAQSALRKLAAQAHGEALTQLMAAWEQRTADKVPNAQELGKSVPASARAGWIQALKSPAAGEASPSLLRLEIAAEVPTPAEHLNARRAMQLHLLTRRNDPSPQQTWPQDVAAVLATAHDPSNARRLQAVLKALMRS